MSHSNFKADIPKGARSIFLTWNFVYVLDLCVQAAKFLTSMRVCTTLSKASLLANAISTNISRASSFLLNCVDHLKAGILDLTAG